MNKEILMIIDTVSNEKNVDRDIIIDAMEHALASAVKKKYKLDNQKAVFLENLKETLKPLEPRSNKYDSELLVAVLDIAEYFFIYGDKEQRNTMKMEAVVEIMKPYFNNDETYLLHSINNVMHKVKRSNIFRRLATRLRIFFSMTMKAS